MPVRSWGSVRSVAAMVTLGLCVWLGLGASSAIADGTCGRHNSSGRTACPLTGVNSTYHGSLTPTYDPYPFFPEHDYYVFHARAGTALIVTLHDLENPTCETEFVQLRLFCGEVSGELEDRSGTQVAPSTGGSNGTATINGAGVPVAATVSDTIRHTGTYYLVLSGEDEKSIGSSSDQPVPYSFNVSAHPGILWPPPCTVPQVRRHLSLLHGELAIRHAGCRVGRVVYRRDPRVPAGDVIAFSPHGGRTVALGTRVRVTVATR
jgi:hypothetical protein